MRYLKRVNGKTLEVHPPDILRWLWQHDGQEAVCVDGNTYYCATEELKRQYEEKWSAEREIGDKRKAVMFIDLARRLHDEGKVKAAATETLPHYCATTEALCSHLLPGSICQHCVA